MYTDKDYVNAIKFALNYPPAVTGYQYDEEKDVYRVNLFDSGWYTLSLKGFFVRSCLTWSGIKKWIPS